jgi:hypothetical protein
MASAIRAAISGARFVGRPPGCLVFASPLEETFSDIFSPAAKSNLSFLRVFPDDEPLRCLFLPLTVVDPAPQLETLMLGRLDTTASCCGVEVNV